MVSQNPPENKIKANCLHFEPSINIVMIDLHLKSLKEIELIKQSLIKQIGFILKTTYFYKDQQLTFIFYH